MVRRAKTEKFEAPPLIRSSVTLNPLLIEAFVRKYLWSKYDNPLPTPPFHREIWAACCDESLRYVLALAPRGHAKSTSITEAYGLAALLFRRRDFSLILSNTWGQSVEFLRDITAELEENDLLAKDFGIRKLLKAAEDDLIVQMTDGHKFRLVARGAEQKVRGIKWNKRRPNLLLLDDLEDDEQVRSKERREKFKDWFMNAVLPCGSDDALFRMGATVLHFDSLAENLSKDPEWTTLRYRAHKSFSDFSNVLWPEKFSETRLRNLQGSYIKQGKRDGYSQEYLNHPIAEGQSFFRPEDLLGMEDYHYQLPLRKYAAWDFAISQKQDADYTVCVVLGVDEANNYYVVDVRRDRWDSLQIIEEMFNVQKAHNCEVHWCEAGQIEKTLAPMLYAEMRERARRDPNAMFTMEPIIPTKDKVSRAASWRAKTRAKGVRYDKRASWWPALEEEMIRFPKGEHDDQVDPQSLLGMQLDLGILPDSTSQEKEAEEYDDNFGRYARMQGRDAVTGY